MSFINELILKLGEMSTEAGNLPQEINSGLSRLDLDSLAEIFWRLTEDHFSLEQQGAPDAKVVIRNGKIEVRHMAAEEKLHLQNQGYLILDWAQYRKAVKELAKVVSEREAHTAKPSTGNILDLELEAEETRPQGLAPSIQLELVKMDHTLQMGLRKLEEDRVKRDKEWQQTLKKWDEEKELRRQQFRKQE